VWLSVALCDAADLGGKVKETASSVKEAMDDTAIFKASASVASKLKDSTASAATRLADMTETRFAQTLRQHLDGRTADLSDPTLARPKPATAEEPIEANEVAKGVIVRPETAWERYMRQMSENSILGGLVGIGSKAGRVAGRVFGETETAAALTVIKAKDAEFSIYRWVDSVREIVIPTVLNAYLLGNLDVLKPRCSDKVGEGTGGGDAAVL
jgi:hypothetical protein